MKLLHVKSDELKSLVQADIVHEMYGSCDDATVKLYDGISIRFSESGIVFFKCDPFGRDNVLTLKSETIEII